MTRTIQEIKNQMTSAFVSNANVQEKYGIAAGTAFEQAFSAVSLENILFYCIAFGHWMLEKLFDTHRQEVLDYIMRMKPHSAAWYVTKAKAFQYGYSLLPDSDLFDNGVHTEDEIEASKIVKYAAVIEQSNQLLMKVAKFDGGDLTDLQPAELAAFAAYINRIRDAGVLVKLLTAPADLLKLTVDVYYNPLVMGGQGQRIDGTAVEPVKDAIKAYLAGIEFDGMLAIDKLVDAVQSVDGVRVVSPKVVQYKYGTLEYQDIDARYSPHSGYIRLDEGNLTINYKV